MAKPTYQSVRDYTQEQIAVFRAIMRSKGFVPDKASRQSALIHYRFILGDRRLELCGWHGTGKGNRHYGDNNIMFSLYDCQTGKSYKEVVDWRPYDAGFLDAGGFGPLTEAGMDAYKAAWTKIIEYAKNIS